MDGGFPLWRFSLIQTQASLSVAAFVVFSHLQKLSRGGQCRGKLMTSKNTFHGCVFRFDWVMTERRLKVFLKHFSLLHDLCITATAAITNFLHTPVPSTSHSISASTRSPTHLFFNSRLLKNWFYRLMTHVSSGACHFLLLPLSRYL